MIYSTTKNQYGYSAADIREYRDLTDCGMVEAKRHFMELYRDARKVEMVKLIESGTIEDIQKIVKILIEDY